MVQLHAEGMVVVVVQGRRSVGCHYVFVVKAKVAGMVCYCILIVSMVQSVEGCGTVCIVLLMLAMRMGDASNHIKVQYVRL